MQGWHHAYGKGRLILLAEILALNKSALCRGASLAFSFVQLHFEWHLAPASLHQRSGKTEPLHSKVIYPEHVRENGSWK